MILQSSFSISMFGVCRLSSTTLGCATHKFILPIRHSLISLAIPPQRYKTRAFGTAAVIAEDRNGGDTFFGEESISWASLGVSESVVQALSKIGLRRPSLVQAACIPRILSGADTVIAAETGSGKTHGYLVPLMDRLCRTYDNSDVALPDEALRKFHQISLVLCPNVMLCEQVVRMANCLCNENGEPLLSVAAVSGRQGWPVREPDIIVSTPVALLNYLYAVDPEKRRRSDFIRGVKYVVFDEADMLLCGSFQNQVICLINMLRFDEKQFSRIKGSETGNSSALDHNFQMDTVRTNGEDIQMDIFPEGNEGIEVDEKFEDTEAKDQEAKRKDWRRVRKSYERSKQYIFVAATLPVNGKKSAGGVLKRLFPDACWVNGNYVHRHNPRLEQRWIEVTDNTQIDALISSVNNGLKSSLNSSSEIMRTMVFANTVEAVEAVAKLLIGAGFECFRYHSDSSLEDRTKNLLDFQQRGGVFVCTDAAARGLDVRNVSHVIQAEFATSAVDFLHRVGRTARAGQPGLVTSLYRESNSALVAAIRQAEKQGQPVEKAFSRKRSFRNKLKKRGLNRASHAYPLEEVLT